MIRVRRDYKITTCSGVIGAVVALVGAVISNNWIISFVFLLMTELMAFSTLFYLLHGDPFEEVK